MGEIYVAVDRELDRRVAVKVLDADVARTPDLRRRFRREALTAARLSGQQHVVTIFDVGEADGRPFIVMEFLPGGTLAERARSQPVPPETALDWLSQAAAALDAAHANGIVHRDVKPANLIFDGRDRLTVVDFGIARLADETAGLTAPGTVLGTPGYLAPEQAQGHVTTAASDRYALGVVAYELLTGGRPFARSSETAEAAAHVGEPVPPASSRGPGLPVAVDAVFERALAKDPAARYPTAAAFVAALADALRERPPAPVSRPRRLPAAAVLAVVLGLLLAGGVAAVLLAPGGEDVAAPAADPGGGATTVVETVTEAAEEDQEPAPAAVEPAATPQEAAELNDRGFARMQEGRWQAALRPLQRAVPALRGTYGDDFRYEAWAEYNLGRTLVELGRCDEAVGHLERSRALQGERREITEALARCS